MIESNFQYKFDVTAFAKLVTMIAVVEQLQAGTIAYLVSTAAFCADGWNIRRQASNVQAAEQLMKEFNEWLFDPNNLDRDPQGGYF